MTGRELVSASLRLIGALAPGESMEATQATDGLAALNRMIDSWSNERLLINAYTPESALTLSPGDATYTLGTSGDITTRPILIAKALIRDGLTDYPVNILTLPQYAAIANKSTQGVPDSLYDDGGYPQRTITLYPVPSSALSLVLFTLRPLAQIATLDASVSLPPGYEDALIYNLALRLSPEYGKVASELVMMTAVESKTLIKRANHRPSLMRCDAIPAGSGSRFDINTGGYR